LFLYLRSTKAKNRTGSIVLWVLVILLLVSHIVNLFSPPPPSVEAIAWAGQAMWLFVLLGFWLTKTAPRANLVSCFDDHRHSFPVDGWRSLCFLINPTTW
jgi:hypothetical protein